MIEKIIVVAPTTAVPINTGFAVALNVLPAPSFSSSKMFGAREVHVDVEVFLDFVFNVRAPVQSATTRKPIARCLSPDHMSRPRS